MIKAFIWATPPDMIGKCKECFEWDGPMWGLCPGCYYLKEKDKPHMLSVWDDDVQGY